MHLGINLCTFRPRLLRLPVLFDLLDLLLKPHFHASAVPVRRIVAEPDVYFWDYFRFVTSPKKSAAVFRKSNVDSLPNGDPVGELIACHFSLLLFPGS
jgi:hypothetical protein